MKITLMAVPAGLLLLSAAGVVPLAEPAAVRIQVGKGRVDFLAGQDLVTRYLVSPDQAKPFFWPVHGPGDVLLTRAWPMEPLRPGGSSDHPHQKSIWFTHGEIVAEDLGPRKEKETVDFWTETKGHGRVVCTRVGEPQVAWSHGRIETHNDWLSAGGARILDEARTFHLYNFGGTRLLVLDIDLRADVPVTFGDTKEGSMGVRVNDQIAGDRGGKIENADGQVGEKACWGRRSAWCDYSGSVGGKAAGIALFDDPSNPPACWHVRAYGLLAANPFGRAKSGFPAVKGKTDLIHLGKGEHLRLRYGILLHPGDAREGKVGDYFERFVKLKG